MEIKTYTTPNDYEQIKLINLTQELRGSSDHPENDAQMIIYRAERMIIDYLSSSYAFKEEDIEETQHSLNMFKLAICDQVEFFITYGLEGKSNPLTGQVMMISPTAKTKLRMGGFMNMRGY